MKTELIIILIIMAILLIALVYLPLLLIIYYAKNQARERKRIQNELIQDNRDILNTGRWFPVKYASQKRFNKLLKFFPWEATGILFIDHSRIIFFSSHLLWKNLQFEIPVHDAKIRLIGKKVWPNGFLSWIAVNLPTGTHYFTSETGTFIMGSKKATENLYNTLVNFPK